MAKHRQNPAGGGDDGSCPKIQPEKPRLEHGDESRGTSSIFSSHQTRPLFGSLEEAHNRITRPTPNGVSSSATTSSATASSGSGSGDDTTLKDMQRHSPVDARASHTRIGCSVTRALSRSVTDAANSTIDEPTLFPSPLLVQKQLERAPPKNNVCASPLTSKTALVDRQGSGEPWKSPPARFTEAQAFAEANISNQPPPYSPKSKLDRAIRPNDPATQGPFAVGSRLQPRSLFSAEGDRCGPKFEPNDPFCRDAQERIRSPPMIALPEDPPFHPRSPFAASARLEASETVMRVTSTSLSPETPFPAQPLYPSSSQDDRAHILSDLGVDWSVGSDSDRGAASDEMPKMLPPPTRMHSARHKAQSRQSLVSSSRSSFIGGGMTERSEEDPFHYDSVFLRPSREREVSAYLHQVSGVERGSTAIIYSPDGSPLKTFRKSLDIGPNSPEMRPMMLDSPVSPPRRSQRAAVYNDGRETQEQYFFEPSAIDPGWTVGSPDVVRVPVRERVQSYQRRSTGGKHHQYAEGCNLILKGLRGCEEQNRLPTGNTEG